MADSTSIDVVFRGQEVRLDVAETDAPLMPDDIEIVGVYFGTSRFNVIDALGPVIPSLKLIAFNELAFLNEGSFA